MSPSEQRIYDKVCQTYKVELEGISSIIALYVKAQATIDELRADLRFVLSVERPVVRRIAASTLRDSIKALLVAEIEDLDSNGPFWRSFGEILAHFKHNKTGFNAAVTPLNLSYQSLRCDSRSLDRWIAKGNTSAHTLSEHAPTEGRLLYLTQDPHDKHPLVNPHDICKSVFLGDAILSAKK